MREEQDTDEHPNDTSCRGRSRGGRRSCLVLLFPGRSATGCTGAAASPAEALAAKDQAIKSTQERVAALEKEVADLQRQVEIKNKQIAEMEKKVGR